jgi:BirA family biotin operon repressor/biotin-[acetyl-CoA-carboxylase] ligase
LEQIEFHPELPSTNDRALELVAQGNVRTPLLVLTERQSAGRGRAGNRWWSDSGALTFSLVVQFPAANLPAQSCPQVSLAVGLAVCEVLERRLPGAQLGLKWPNDVYLDRRKVCGILVEVPPGKAETMVVGVGLNVNNSFASAPAQLQAIATSLFDATGRKHHLTDVLVQILGQVAERLQLLRQGGLDLSGHWESRCLLRGRTVRVTAGNQQTIGVCRGIDPQGALLLESSTGVERCFAGVVTWIE